MRAKGVGVRDRLAGPPGKWAQPRLQRPDEDGMAGGASTLHLLGDGLSWI